MFGFCAVDVNLDVDLRKCCKILSLAKTKFVETVVMSDC